MNANLFYAAAVLGAVALYLLMQPRASAFRAALTVGGLAAVGLLLTTVARSAPAPTGSESDGPFWLYVLLALGGISGAVRMVTHPKPVYAALYFILVVLSTAVLFLMMQAEFMAFALLIVYAGAILITYLFVLMLAQQAQHAPDEHGHQPGKDGAAYDRLPREPIAAVLLGLILVAATGEALFGNSRALPWATSPAVAARANARAWERLEAMPQLLLEEAATRAATAGFPGATALERSSEGRALSIDPSGATATVTVRNAQGATQTVTLTGEDAPGNARSLGHALVAQFPVSLELAGVILLMAMFGAVVLARRQMEMAEDERRVAAGLPRIAPDEPLSSRGGAA